MSDPGYYAAKDEAIQGCLIAFRTGFRMVDEERRQRSEEADRVLCAELRRINARNKRNAMEAKRVEAKS